MKGVIGMIQLAKFLRDAFVTILAILTAFGMGYIACSKMFERAFGDVAAAIKKEPNNRVSYRGYYGNKD